VELKSTPVKKTSKGLTSKERLVFNKIDYNEEYKASFATSSFWKKNQLLLLLFYLHEKEKLDIDLIFKIIRLWQFPATDLKIMKDDWERIVKKIKAGKAHEISEGDSLYLGACTKGANKKSLSTQPFSDKKAMHRAFSLKSKYLNFIIDKSLKKEKVIIDYDQYDLILGEGTKVEEPLVPYIRLAPKYMEPVVRSLEEYQEGETFEDLVIKKFETYYGQTDTEIINNLMIRPPAGKNRVYVIAKSILGIKKGKIEEFEKADVEMKTIRLEYNGNIKESMSFPQIQFKEIIDEEWDESFWHDTLTKRFFFVVFQKNKQGELVLKKVMFWTMPAKDLEVAGKFWIDTQKKIKQDDYNHFIKISDNMICHVRPKGINSKDVMETPTGRFEKKKSYWLNSSYIKEIIK
jgi:DNA mismatch repair protein MutH